MSALSQLNQLLLEGRLMAAVEACKQAVKSQPSQIEPRVALYELSVFLGDWDRCKNQVETIMSLGGDPLHWLGHMANIHAAKSRAACWQGRERPPVIGDCDADDQQMFNRYWRGAGPAPRRAYPPVRSHAPRLRGLVCCPPRDHLARVRRPRPPRPPGGLGGLGRGRVRLAVAGCGLANRNARWGHQPL